jgi:hypothetical protein
LFDVKLKNMLPNSIYTVWTLRTRRIPGNPGFDSLRQPDSLAEPNVITTDAKGKGRQVFKVTHPFPDPLTDTTGRRIIGLTMTYHSDHQSWGACVSRLGVGVDHHIVFNTIAEGSFNMAPFHTVAPR